MICPCISMSWIALSLFFSFSLLNICPAYIEHCKFLRVKYSDDRRKWPSDGNMTKKRNQDFICEYIIRVLGFPSGLVVKNPPANAGDLRDVDSITWSGRSPGGWHGNPLQYSCLENLTDRGTWWVTVHGVTQRLTWPKWLSMHACSVCFNDS